MYQTPEQDSLNKHGIFSSFMYEIIDIYKEIDYIMYGSD